MDLKGSIVIKKNRGKMYYVHQYREGNKVVNRSLSENKAYELAFQLEYSKHDNYEEFKNHQFETDVQFGMNLFYLFEKSRNFNKRYCFETIQSFLYDENVYGKVLALYGLRRTGKTTLIFQSLASLSLFDYAKAAYIKISPKDSFRSLTNDLSYLTEHGFQYIFIDEVTLMKDFISLSSTLSDIYGLRAKIILSGTDSLGLMMSKYDELYDRVIFIHTTYISFKEFSEVLNKNSIDEYIEYGGLMSIESKPYQQNQIFSIESVNEYVDSAIAHNIEHSLKYYQDGDHFGALYPLYEKHELTNVINRLIEDSNHRFAISVIEQSFKSHDYGSLKNLVLKHPDPEYQSSLDEVDEKKVISLLMNELSIINKEKQSQKVDEHVLSEIDSYLDLLDLCKEIDVVRIPSFYVEKRKLFIQPGLRYSQAKSLLEILFKQPKVLELPIKIRLFLKEKLLSDIKGRMLEEIVVYQTFQSGIDAFKVMFPIGEIDLVSLDNQKQETSLYEVKYSTETHPRQSVFLHDEEKLSILERAYYPIVKKAVLYRGESKRIDDIDYINVEEYLKSL